MDAFLAKKLRPENYLVADFDPYQAGGPFGDADPDIFTQQFWHDGGLFGIADQLQRGAEDNEDPKISINRKFL